MGFIYKITNTLTGKCYIGETQEKDPEDRWKGHMRAINRNTGCPALRDAIHKYGADNFKFEVLIICFDEDRFIYEKEYIKKYNSQVPHGYNILPGGEGGGFHGKKHTSSTIEKIKKGISRFRKENPNYFETYREKLRKSMEKVDISSAVKNSEKYMKAVEEGRVGGKLHKQSEETKEKIRQSGLKYFREHDSHVVNIEKHRNTMALIKGRKIKQYSKDNELIKEYISISEAGRISGVKKNNIQHVIDKSDRTAGGYIWKYAK